MRSNVLCSSWSPSCSESLLKASPLSRYSRSPMIFSFPWPFHDTKRHQGEFSNVPLPKPSSFNEVDVSDKPAWVRNTPRLKSGDVSYLRWLYRQRLRSLQSVDEMVGRMV